MSARNPLAISKADILVALPAELERSLKLTRRVQKRLGMQLGRIKDHGLPSQEWLELARWAASTVASLARVAAEGKIGGVADAEFTPEELAEEARIMTIETLRNASLEERMALITEADRGSERANHEMIDAESVENYQ